MLTFGPKLTVAAESSAIATADPRPLFWVTGVVLGLLALWVVYVYLTGQSNKPVSHDGVPSDPKPSSNNAE